MALLDHGLLEFANEHLTNRWYPHRRHLRGEQSKRFLTRVSGTGSSADLSSGRITGTTTVRQHQSNPEPPTRTNSISLACPGADTKRCTARQASSPPETWCNSDGATPAVVQSVAPKTHTGRPCARGTGRRAWQLSHKDLPPWAKQSANRWGSPTSGTRITRTPCENLFHGGGGIALTAAPVDIAVFHVWPDDPWAGGRTDPHKYSSTFVGPPPLVVVVVSCPMNMHLMYDK
ncbi:hypothetical protein EDB86DRAFT_2914305 [Lactarius hatsudake]|nr:hypothetical protein EDB86DRAFT_2914305 [Lactarius hatsudake]